MIIHYRTANTLVTMQASMVANVWSVDVDSMFAPLIEDLGEPEELNYRSMGLDEQIVMAGWTTTTQQLLWLQLKHTSWAWMNVSGLDIEPKM